MGLAKHGRLTSCIVLALGLCAVLVIAGTSGCKSRTKSVSSASFLGPQAALAPDGSKEIALAISKLSILMEAKKVPGQVIFPADLVGVTARLFPIGKLDATHLVVYESETKTILTLDFDHNTVTRNLTDVEVTQGLFNSQATKPVIGQVIRLQSGWLLGYESSSRSLFAIRQNPDGDGLVWNFVMDQPSMGNEVGSGNFSIKSMMEYKPGQVLVLSDNPTIRGIYRLIVDDKTDPTKLTATFETEEGVTADPLISYKDHISPQTGDTQVDVKGFPLIKVPDNTKDEIILFDRETTSFLLADIHSDLSVTVEAMTSRDDMLTAVQGVNTGGQAFTGLFDLNIAFLHPDAGLAATDSGRKPLVIAYDSQTNNLISYDFSKKKTDTGKIAIFSSSNQYANRTDLSGTEVGTTQPSLTFSPDNVVDNKIAFDAGAGQLIAYNYETGEVIVVLNQGDFTALSGLSTVAVSYVMTLDPPPDGKGTQLRVLENNSGSVIGVHLDYQAIPVSYPH